MQGVGFVELDEFVGHELAAAARLLNGEPEKRIILTAAGRAGPSYHFSPVAEGILRSLRHPVVWGGYASLPESARNGVLDGELVHLGQLAEQMHRRFLIRCRVRKRWKDEQMLDRALPEIARSTGGPPPYPSAAWDLACQPCLGPAEARDLYNESLSYGIIVRDEGRSWRWGHPFLVDHFAAISRGDANE